jgi:hypothetical protein
VRIELEPVTRIRLTILMGNVTDPLLRDAGPVTRLTWPKALAEGAPQAPAKVWAEGAVPDGLVAEPGAGYRYRLISASASCSKSALSSRSKASVRSSSTSSVPTTRPWSSTGTISSEPVESRAVR